MRMLPGEEKSEAEPPFEEAECSPTARCVKHNRRANTSLSRITASHSENRCKKIMLPSYRDVFARVRTGFHMSIASSIDDERSRLSLCYENPRLRQVRLNEHPSESAEARLQHVFDLRTKALEKAGNRIHSLTYQMRTRLSTGEHSGATSVPLQDWQTEQDADTSVKGIIAQSPS
jgi:hypothetical protein